MNILYIRLAGVAVLLLAILGVFLHINSLHAQVKTLNLKVLEGDFIIGEQKKAINLITENSKAVEKRLKDAEEKTQIIKTKVITRLKTVPAVPVTCPDSISWLRDRAIELQKDFK